MTSPPPKLEKLTTPGPPYAVIATNNLANEHLHAIVVVPLTDNTERLYTFELLLPVQRTGLDHDSKAQPQFVWHVSKAKIRRAPGPPVR